MTIEEFMASTTSELAWLNGLLIFFLVVFILMSAYLMWRLHVQQEMIDDLETKLLRMRIGRVKHIQHGKEEL